MAKTRIPALKLRVVIPFLSLLLLFLYVVELPRLLVPKFPVLHKLDGPSAGERYIRSRQSAPAWCANLALNPKRDMKTKECRVDGRMSDEGNEKCGRFFSQYDQDIWIWHAIAQFMDSPGVYVDVGSNHPSFISNSYFFDRCLGWRGVCVEAQEKYHQRLRERRTCTVAPCVSDKEGDVEFVHADDLGGIASTNKNVNGTQDWQEKARVANRSKVHCVPLKDVLRKEGIREITYMSLDVEGAEMMVLKGVDWHQTHIAFITMEGSADNPAAEFLTRMGYTMVYRTGDSFFVSKKALKSVESLMGKGYLKSIRIPDQ